MTSSDKSAPRSDKSEAFEETHHLAFLLVPGFSLMSYASVVEPFRAANTLAGRPLYRWTHVSPDGAPAAASNGASILADRSAGGSLDCDTLFVFAAGKPAEFEDERVFAWLRRLGRAGVRLVGVSGAPFLLARAGVLEGHRMTIHWEHREQLLDAFPELTAEPGLFVIDRRRLTCAGGIAALDMCIEMIERAHGHELAARVGEWFISPGQRPAEARQRKGLRERYGISDDRVLKALARMEESVEEPLASAQLAAAAGVSLRQLERLFRYALGQPIGATYLRIRLEKAHELLQQTGLPVTSVALACGFRSASHFARVFRARYGHPPSLK